MDEDRGTGRTTRQLAALPYEGWFIVPTYGMRDYTLQLARRIGRKDIKVLHRNELDTRMYQGRYISGYDVDHATYDLISHRQMDTLHHHLRALEARVRDTKKAFQLAAKSPVTLTLEEASKYIDKLKEELRETRNDLLFWRILSLFGTACYILIVVLRYYGV